MGGVDKGLVPLAGRLLIDYVIDRLAPQVETIIINANRNTERYRQFGVDVIGEQIGGYLGPLAGMLSGMRAAKTGLIVTAPFDSPFLPPDLVERLQAGLSESTRIAVAHDGERMQPVFSLLDVALADSLSAYLDSGERKIDRWFAQRPHSLVNFSDSPDTFLNINTPEQCREVEHKIKGRSV